MIPTKSSVDSRGRSMTDKYSLRSSSHKASKPYKNYASGSRKLVLNTSYRSLCSFHMDERGICFDTDCDSEPDRSNPLWKIQPPEEPEVVVESETTISEKIQPILWEEIMTEYEDKRKEFFNLVDLTSPYEAPLPVFPKLSVVQYLEKHIFPLLCPILRKTLNKAKERDCLMLCHIWMQSHDPHLVFLGWLLSNNYRETLLSLIYGRRILDVKEIQKCRFNGLDYIAQLLWNNNPLYPERRLNGRDIFDIPYAIIWLHFNPRPIYPRSWIWSKEEAITVMQTYIRRYLVCKEPDCSEMRQFWKAVRVENAEEKRARKEKFIEELEKMFNDILDKLVENAVMKGELKMHGCHCRKKPCHCVCKCKKWCKCCSCR